MNATPQRTETNPAGKYYSGIVSMTLAVISLFFLTPLFSIAALVTGTAAIVYGGKLDNRKLRGEGIIGTTVAALVLLGWFFIFSGG